MAYKNLFRKILKPNRGASMLGYGLIVGLIAVVALSATSSVGTQVTRLFNFVSVSVGGEGPPDVSAPSITATSFSVDEDAAIGFAIGTIVASDDVAVTSFTITAGDTGGFFALNTAGDLSVSATGGADGSGSLGLDFETQTSFTLTVAASDAAGNSDTADIAITVNDVVEPTSPAIAWGAGSDGRLGNGSSGNESSPVNVTAPATGSNSWEVAAAGSQFSCALQSFSNNILCWGYGGDGQLGGNNNNDQSSPTIIATPPTGTNIWQSVIAGASHTCGIQSGTNEAFCWGDDGFGQLGDSDTNDQNNPVAVSTPPTGTNNWEMLSGGSNHSCGIQSTTLEAFCWGRGDKGQIGDSNTGNHNSPIAVSLPPTGTNSWVMIASGGNHNCAIQSSTNAAFCWGRGDNGQLGNSGSNNQSSPVAVSNPPTGTNSWQVISAGGTHSCAIQSGTNEAFCWGAGANGRLGNSGSGNQNSPVAVSNPPSGSNSWQIITAGNFHSCAIQSTTSTAFCWGQGTSSQLGNAATIDENSPVAVSGSNSFTTLSIGGVASHTIGILLP